MSDVMITRGDTERLDVTVTGFTEAELAAADLTFTAKPRHDATPTIQKTSAAGEITTSGLVATVLLNPADTTALPNLYQFLFYDVVAVYVGNTYTLAKGRVTIDPKITT